ncbi:PTS galactitol transporter subunit IIC [Alkalibacterium putridalgicola]|uniref:PTS galactitol transporter subunit IIC n=1 Tax=Alkalibacterium putridalgicola TaxID=426703 RepID=UPI0034CF8FCA
MDILINIVNAILNVGPTAILPISITIIGLIFGTGFKKAFKSGITIGIGFVGVSLIIGLLDSFLAPAAQGMIDNFGLELNVIDAGWPAAAAAAFAMPIAPLLIPIILLVNIALIFFKVTKTLNVDIWNFWHMIAAGSTGYIVTNGNIWFAVLITIIYEAIVLLIADWTQPYVEKFFGLEGLTFPTGSPTSFGLIGIPIAWAVGKIPGIGNLNADSETIQEKFGIFGEPMMIGLILGTVVGLLGYGFGIDEVLQAFQVGISMGAVMLLMPRMVKIFMEGLIPISDAASKWMKKRFPGRELFIGVDAALAVGHPGVLSTSLVLVPITILIAVLLPGNAVLPFGDLVGITFFIVFVVAASKGNLVQSIITGTIMMVLVLWMATSFAPVHTEMMQGTGFTATEGANQITSLTTGGSPLNYLLYLLSEFAAPFVN